MLIPNIWKITEIKRMYIFLNQAIENESTTTVLEGSLGTINTHGRENKNG